MLLEQALECIVDPLLAYVLAQRVHREGALAVAKVRAGGPKQRGRGAHGLVRIRLPHPAQESAQMVEAVGFLHDLIGGVPRQAFGQQDSSLDSCVRQLTAPPLVRYLVCHHRKHEIEAPRIVLWIQEGESFLIVDRGHLGMHSTAVTGMLDEPDVAVRVWPELLAVVAQRGSYTPDHAVQIRRVPRVMEDLDRDVVPPSFMHRVVGGEEGVLVPDGDIGGIVEVAASAFRPRPDERPRRDGDLTLVRAHDRFEGDPLGSGRRPARFNVVEGGDDGARSEPVRPPVPGITELAIWLVAEGGQPTIREVGAVRHHGGVDSAVKEATGFDIHLEAEPQRVAWLERLLQRA